MNPEINGVEPIALQKILREEMQAMLDELSHSAHAGKADEEGRFPAARSEAKELQDAIVNALRDHELFTKDAQGFENYAERAARSVQFLPEPLSQRLIAVLESHGVVVKHLTRDEIDMERLIIFTAGRTQLPESEVRQGFEGLSVEEVQRKARALWAAYLRT